MKTMALSTILAVTAPAAIAAPMTDYFGAGNRCYARIYSDAHLKKHPQQKVLAIRFDHMPGYSGPFDSNGHPLTYPAHREIVATLTVTLKGVAGSHSNTAFCWAEGKGMACGMECDAGQFKLAPRSGGRLLIHGGGDLFFHGCGSGDMVTLTRAPDDRAFLLSPMPSDQCRPPR